MNRQQQDVIDYLQEEVKVLKEQQRSKRHRLTDEERARLARCELPTSSWWIAPLLPPRCSMKLRRFEFSDSTGEDFRNQLDPLRAHFGIFTASHAIRRALQSRRSPARGLVRIPPWMLQGRQHPTFPDHGDRCPGCMRRAHGQDARQ